MAITLPNPELRQRRSLRLTEYDYAQPGGYFVTLCAHERECLFGDVVSGEVVLNRLGTIVAACWTQLPKHFPRVELDAFVLMPNHLHGVLILHESDDPSESTPATANECRGEALAPRTDVPSLAETDRKPEVFPSGYRANASPSPGSTVPAYSGNERRGEAFAPCTNASLLTITDDRTAVFPSGQEANASPSPGSPSNRPVAVPDSKGEAFAQNPKGMPVIQTGEEPSGASHTHGANASPLHPPPFANGTASGSLAAVIQNFKSVTARRINQLRRTPGAPVWQRNYYEHIIRNQASLDEIREYIAQNPARWGLEDEDVGRERTQGI